MPDIATLLDLLARYGYILVFVGVFLESAGVPVPGETVLVAAGVLAERGSISLAQAIAVGVSAAILGDQFGYAIGRLGGRPFVLRWGRFIAITLPRLERAERFFELHGGKAVFLARFVPGLRVFGALMAGVSRMPWHTFAIYNALGGTLWATGAVLVGYFAGSSYRVVERSLGTAGAIVAGLLAVVFVVTLLARRHRKRRVVDEASPPTP
ncbi:MAG: DedA family protein [Thermoleophilia bacterium]|nr:DedA family protein [Thermoleophilia bacterium]